MNNFNNLIRAYILMSCCIYHTGRKFSLDLNFAISLMVKPLNFNSANFKIVRSLSMMAYITKIQKSKFANINSMNLTILDEVAILNAMYIFIL